MFLCKHNLYIKLFSSKSFYIVISLQFIFLYVCVRGNNFMFYIQILSIKTHLAPHTWHS